MTREAAERYHRLSSYEPGRDWDSPIDDPLVRQDIEQNDPALLPPPVKRYAQALETVALRQELPSVEIPAGEVLAGRVRPSDRGLDLAGLARLLHLSAGIVRISQKPGGPRYLLRAAGSAGARFPLELYVAARGVGGLDDGVWWYDPEGHALRRIGPPAADGGTTVVVTGVPWRTGWRYAERGYRHLYWDGGTMLAQLLAVAASAGLPARLWSRFPDARVSDLVGADGVHEFPLALVALGPGAPATEAGGTAERGAVDDTPQEYPLLTLTQRAGDLDELGDPWAEGELADGAVPDTPTLDEVILRRGSTRLMDRSAAVSREQLEWPMAVSMRGIDIAHFVAAHGVEGLPPGLYRWPDLATPVHTRITRDRLMQICIAQDLGGAAAYVVIAAADLGALDARGYREAQLAAGLVEGRLHLAAYALGIGASGMTFYDSEIEGLLGEPLAGLIFTCVGVPEYRSRAGGRPGRPTSVSPPAPRLGPL